MQSPARFLGMVRVWQEGDQWRWAPEDAAIAQRLRFDGEDLLHVGRRTLFD